MLKYTNMSLRPPQFSRKPDVIRAAAASMAAAWLIVFAPAASAAPLLAPFTAGVTSPTAGGTVAGTTTLVARLSDQASSGHFTVTPLVGGATTVAAAPDGIDPLTWSAAWNSATVPNGGYTITFSAVRMSDSAPSESVARTFTVNNAVVAPPALAATVTAPAALATLAGASVLQASTNIAADSLTFVITPRAGGG
ncbi:MAG: hypothetical protein RL272_1102, partial [Candidatus Parcubacteria bacterium]